MYLQKYKLQNSKYNLTETIEPPGVHPTDHQQKLIALKLNKVEIVVEEMNNRKKKHRKCFAFLAVVFALSGLALIGIHFHHMRQQQWRHRSWNNHKNHFVPKNKFSNDNSDSIVNLEKPDLQTLPNLKEFESTILDQVDHHCCRNCYVNCTTTKFDNTTHSADLHCELVQPKRKEQYLDQNKENMIPEKSDIQNKDLLNTPVQNSTNNEGRKLMERVKNWRGRGGPIRGVTVIIDHHCFVLFKRHGRDWWRRHWRQWWRHHRCCVFIRILCAVFHISGFFLLLGLLGRCCCKRKCKRMMTNYVRKLSEIENKDESGVYMTVGRSFRRIEFEIRQSQDLNLSMQQQQQWFQNVQVQNQRFDQRQRQFQNNEYVPMRNNMNIAPTLNTNQQNLYKPEFRDDSMMSKN